MEIDPLGAAEPASTNASPGKLTKEKSSCSICREDGDGFHFGAEACRACAAFFRRSIALSKCYECRGNGNCDITANIRCMCRACRLAKCLEVGMNPAGVQQRRDTLGRRDLKAELPDSTADLAQMLGSIGESVPTTSQSPLPNDLPQSCLQMMPILVKMRQNYVKMDNARVVIHRRDGQSIFKEKTPKAVNYKEAGDQAVKEVSLVADWIVWCFDEFVALETEQKKVLFRNFYTPFTMLEGSFLCRINNTKTSAILPSGDYIDMERLDTFFYDPDAEQPMSSEEIDKMFKPTFDLVRRSLIEPMINENIDVYEFFALCTLCFWDFGLDGQSDYSIAVGKRVKNQVMKELAFYLKNVQRISEPSVRVASLLTILPAVQRCARRFQEDLEITHVFNVYAPHEDFYNIVNGKFC